MYLFQKNTELYLYEEPFKITIVIKKCILLLLFIHFLLTNCTVTYTYLLQLHSHIYLLSNYKLLFSSSPYKTPVILPNTSPPAGRKRKGESSTASDHFHTWWQDTIQTARWIPLPAPSEKSSLLRSPVLCHTALWVVVCKMGRQLHDLVLLIKGSALTVYLWPTPMYYRVFILC